MKRTKSIIIDCETLGLDPSAMITEIGAIAFDRRDFSEAGHILLKPSVFEQMRAGRSYDPGTLDFHSSHGTLPSDLADCYECKTVAILLENFFIQYEPERVWIQGTCFDRPLIENFMRQNGRGLPWEFWRSRDARTAWDMAFPGEKHPKRDHEALSDCRATLECLKASAMHISPENFQSIV